MKIQTPGGVALSLSRFRLHPLLLAMTGLLSPWSAIAADAAAVRTEQVTTLSAVTVTARRSEEAARDVPFSITTISGEEAEMRRLYSLEDLLRQVPSVNFVTNMGMGNTTLRIRGVGALQKVSGDDTSVVINVDGLPLSATNATLNILDAERVEVLKGPQGTLFGRNAEAGAINITTRRPTRWFEGYVHGEVGQDNEYLLEGVVSGPLTETLSARLAVRSAGIDGVLTNLEDGKTLNKPREQVFRGSLLWEPTARTRLLLTAGQETLKNRDNDYVLYPYGDPPAVDQPPGSLSDRRRANRYTAELTHEMDDSVLTVLSGYTDTDHRNTSPIYEGRTYMQLLGFRPDARWSTFSDEKTYNQEIRLGSKPGASLFWVAGVNFYHAKRSWDRRDSYDRFYPENPFNADIDRNFETDTQALFGEVTFPLSEKTRLTTGIRYTWEKKDYDAYWSAHADNPSPIRQAWDKQRRRDDYLTGRLALSHALTGQLNLYGVYARGNKAGGFNEEGTNFAAGLADPTYKPATVDSLEAGFKFESADGKRGLDTALFFNQVKDDHLLTFDPRSMAALVENHDTESKGIELEGFWKPGAGFTLSGGVAYIDAKIKGHSASEIADGNGVPEVPKWGANLSINHRLPLPAFLWMKSPILNTRLTNRYVGNRPADVQNTFDLGSYNKLDFRVGIQNRGMEIYFWADNLLGKQYDLYGYYLAPYYPGGSDARIGYPSRGRSLGIGATIAF